MNLYFISGLGADKRAFQKLILPSHVSIHHIEWIKPLEKETLDSYAYRLAGFIDTSKPFALVGLSFGGMIATSMNRFLKPEKTFLISSISVSKEIPWYFKLSGLLKLHTLIPISLLNHPTKLIYWMFGANTDLERKLLSQIIIDSDPHFVKWCLGALLQWHNKERPKDVIHIHGDKDKILPIRFVNSDIVINEGSHFMVWTKAKEVSHALTTILNHSYKT